MSSDEQKWWLAPPGMQPEGPFTISEIHARVESAPKDTDWQICMEGSVQWQPLTNLPAFAESTDPSSPPTAQGVALPLPEATVKNYLLWMHLSQLGNLLFPPVGFVVPLVLWITKKDESELIDRQGREIANWMIFYVIFMGVMGLLSIVPFVMCLTLPAVMVMVVLGVVYPIIGSFKASSGEFYRYPMFFRLIT